MKLTEETKIKIQDLKSEWIKVVNSFDDYKDKEHYWNELRHLDNQIKELTNDTKIHNP